MSLEMTLENSAMVDDRATGSIARLQETGALSFLFRYHGLALSQESLMREFAGVAVIGDDEIVRIVRRQGLKARKSRGSFDRLSITPLPAFAGSIHGGAMIILRASADKVLVIRGEGLARGGEGARPELIDRAPSERVARLKIEMTRLHSVLDLNGRALAASKSVSERILKSVADVLNDQRAQTVGYGRDANLSRQSASSRNAAIALDSRV